MKKANGIGHTPAGVLSKKCFSRKFEKHFYVPPRLRDASGELVDSVNDWHFAMINDENRNEFYFQLLQHYIIPEKTKVIEIGAGSGILSMMAASLGAKSVLAIEGSLDMARLARINIQKSNFAYKIKVVNAMSTDVQIKDYPDFLPADVLVSEMFGTLLLGESALDYISDILSRRMLTQNVVLPRFGAQYAFLIDCPHVESISSVHSYRGIDLSAINDLRDTASVVFTKQYGFRLNSVPFKMLSKPIRIFEVDFAKDRPGFLPLISTREVVIQESGSCSAIVLFWSAYEYIEEKRFQMSTNPEETLHNFCRDMQWGQAIQLVEFEGAIASSSSLSSHVNAGEIIEMVQRVSHDSVLLQFGLRRL